ncbi:reverse transcriptase domain-containing protein, partial [Tanacetum coccineum]
LDPNVRFNLSFNLLAIERDITNDDDVEFFIDCATKSITDEMPHLYIRPPKVEARIIPGPVGILQKALARKSRRPWLQAIVYLHGEGVIVSGCLGDMKKHCINGKLELVEYIRKVNEDVSQDDHFMQGPWLQAIVYLHGEGVIVSGCLGDMKKHCINGKLELVVGVVKSCTPNSLGDMTVILKDLTGTMGGTIHYKVFKNENDGYAKSIKVVSVLILRNVSVWTPKPSQHYLNITIRNIVKVFDNDTEF